MQCGNNEPLSITPAVIFFVNDHEVGLTGEYILASSVTNRCSKRRDITCCQHGFISHSSMGCVWSFQFNITYHILSIKNCLYACDCNLC